MQILVGIVVVHIIGHVKLHAAQCVHDLADGLPLHRHIEIRDDAGEISHLLLQPFDAPGGGVHRVDLFDLPGHVDHSIPWNVDAVHRAVGHVIGHQNHGIRISAAAGILPQQQECEHVFLPAGGHIRLPVAVQILVRGRGLSRRGLWVAAGHAGTVVFTDIRGLDKYGPPACRYQYQGYQTAQRNDAGLPSLSPALPAAAGLRLFYLRSRFFRCFGLHLLRKGVAALLPAAAAGSFMLAFLHAAFLSDIPSPAHYGS